MFFMGAMDCMGSMGMYCTEPMSSKGSMGFMSSMGSIGSMGFTGSSFEFVQCFIFCGIYVISWFYEFFSNFG